MRKFIAIFIILVTCVSMIGCTAQVDPTTPVEIDISKFPDAKEFDTYQWPSIGLGADLPTPMWSNRGRILLDTENTVWTQIGYSTLDNYNDYLRACQEAGFTVNYFNLADTMYYGEDADGHALMLVYSKYEYFVDVKVATDTSEWDLWWEEN